VTARYRYRAATTDGRLVEGMLQAGSRPLALEELRRQRLYPVAVEEDVGTAAAASRLTRGPGRRVSVSLWTRNLAILLGAGLPLDRALAFTASQVRDPEFADVVRQLRRAVQEGSGLAEALARHPRFFPPIFVAMVSAGEMSGALDAVFTRLSDYLEEVAELRSQVRAALLYPALMAVVSSLGIMVLLLFVVPRFSAMLTEVGGQLPLTTRALLAVGAVVRWWWLWLPLVAAGVAAAGAALRRPDVRKRFDAARLRWPVFGDLELKYTTARFTRTLAVLQHSGVPILPALRVARAAATNVAVGEGIERATAAVARGEPLAPALNGVLPPLALQMLAVGEESGRLEELCARVADTYDTEVRRALRSTVALIEPAMILVFGALVGFVALAMLQAIYSINTSAF
jgi:type II secretory pathway component PulF